MRSPPAKLWLSCLVVLLSVVLVGVGVLVATPFSLVLLPDGGLFLARTQPAVELPGGRYRFYIQGSDGIIRRELDTNRDGVYDVRGDDWHGATPSWCSTRGASGWTRTTPAHCEEAWKRLVGDSR